MISWRSLWKEDVRTPLLLTLVIKVLLLVFLMGTHGFIAFSEVQYANNAQFRTVSSAALQDPGFTGKVPFMFSHFDAQWYLQIAREGYNPQGVTQEPKNVAFYPLYPALIWATSWLGGQDWSAFFVSNALTFVMAVLMYALTKRLADHWGASDTEAGRVALLGTLLLLVHPMAIFFMASYTESLFLSLVLGALLAAWKDKPALAGVFGMLAALTKVQGLLLLPVLVLALLEVRLKKGPRWRDLWLLLVPTGMGLWCLYMWHITGDPFASFDVQKVFGMGRPGGFDPSPLWEVLQHLSTWHSYRNSPYDVFATLVTGGLFVLGWRKLGWSLRLYGVLMLVVPLLSWSIMSMGRYTLLVFPVTVLLAWWSAKRPIIQAGVVSGSLLLCSLFAVMYTHHMWVG